MLQRRLQTIELLMCGLSFGVAGQLRTFDLFGSSALKTAACDACGKGACWCKPDIFKCRPEARYCKPEHVCGWKKYCVTPLYCKPENVCLPCVQCVRPWYCKPEPICRHPEPRCCDKSQATKGKAVIKGR